MDSDTAGAYAPLYQETPAIRKRGAGELIFTLRNLTVSNGKTYLVYGVQSGYECRQA
jgi:hypothetical protein